MDTPGRQACNHTKLTDKYIAGRGRALKEFARRSLKAEEVERRKQIQQLILSGKIALNQDTIEIHPNTSINGSGSNSVLSSSSQQQQVEEKEDDYTLDLTHEKMSSKAPVGYCQLEGQLQTKPITNNLENHMQKLSVAEEDKNSVDDRIPPRFRNSQWNKNFKKQTNKPWVKQQSQSYNNRKPKVEIASGENWDINTVPQEPMPSLSGTQQTQTASLDPWHDWEASVVVHGPIDDEDLEDIVIVDDNDNLDDVMVQQYVSALHEEQTNGAKPEDSKSSKVTPSRIQELGRLKSTTNADAYQVPPGTVPNPPKGPDRWGGSELKDISEPTGWGDIVEDSGNWYDDGTAMMWGTPSLPYGASGGWSWNS